MKKNFLDLLKELVSYAPVSSDKAAVNQVSRRLAEFLREHGIRVETEQIDGREVVYASCLPEGKVSEVLFNAHIDVVPLSSSEQRVPEEKAGRLYGRGTGDCLGHAVCIAQILCESKGKSVAAIFTADEEIGGETTAGMIDKGYIATRGVVILDTYAENRIVCAEKGAMNVTLTAHGKTGHAAYPWQGENALEKLMTGFAKLRGAWSNPVQEENWQDSLEATCISSSSQIANVMPETASLNLNIRFVTPGGEEEILNRIRAITGLSDVRISSLCPPVILDESLPFFQKTLDACSQVYGHPFGFSRMNGATDARHFSKAYPTLPIVMTGIRHGNIHAAGEWCDLADAELLVDACKKIL